jgi:hypothetical protein
MTAVPLVGRVEPSIPASPVAHVAASAGVGVIVGGIAAAAVRYAHDPVSANMYLDQSRPEAVLTALAGGLVVGPVVAAVFRSARLLLAVASAAFFGGPVLALVLAFVVSGDAAGGPDRFVCLALAVAAVYAFAGALTAPGARNDHILAAGVAVVLALTLLSILELRSQDRWRAWDVAHQGVDLVLPDIPGFQPTGMRFASTGIQVRMSSGNGEVLVDLLDREASRVRSCGSGPCWEQPGDRWASGTVVTRRYGDRLIQILPGQGAPVAVSIDIPLRPVTAERLAALPTLPPPDYAD